MTLANKAKARLPCLGAGPLAEEAGNDPVPQGPFGASLFGQRQIGMGHDDPDRRPSH